MPGAVNKFNVAKQYALNYFKKLGIEMAAKPVDLSNTSSLTEGTYAVFWKGGHVLYGSFSRAHGLIMLDEQTGQTFNSIISAQNCVGMQFAGTYRVVSAVSPLQQLVK